MRKDCVVNISSTMKYYYDQDVIIFPHSLNRYDFMLEFDGYKFFVEFNGRQHFELVELFHGDILTFRERQQKDIIKTLDAIRLGYNIIRIDHTQINNISFNINRAYLYTIIRTIQIQNYINIL